MQRIIHKTDRKTSAHYVILRTLGKGAFGTVYLAHLVNDSDENPRKFALKETYQDEKYKNREGEILKMLNHPGIVKVFSIFYTRKPNGKKYLDIVMEHFPSSLHDLLQLKASTDNMLTYTDIKYYTLQLFRTVGYLATLQLCHRDIKPSNILVNHSKRIIKVCDFGSAKQLTDSEANKSYICSRFYRAPELLCRSTFYSCAVDLWSVGCCMAEMYLNYPLFNGSNTKHQLRLIKNILAETPTNYPSNTITDYSRNKGIALASKWKQVLKIDTNYAQLEYPKEKLMDINSCDDVQFIREILQYNPKKRLNLKETLNHSYFKQFVFQTKSKSNHIYPALEWTENELKIINSL